MGIHFFLNASLLATLAINLGLAGYLYLKGRNIEANRVFSLIMFFIAGWTLSFLLFFNATDPDWLLFWRRTTPIGSALIAGMFLYFCLIFPQKTAEISVKIKLLIFGPGIIFSFLSVVTDWLVAAISIRGGDYLTAQPIFGWAYRAYALFNLNL